jgi:hypothetical protein
VVARTRYGESPVLAGPFLIAAAVLALAGASKATDPRPTRLALAGVGLRVGAPAVRALGAVELAVAVAAAAFGGTLPAVAMAALYLAFDGYIVVARRRGATGGCGCFGASSAPPTNVHLFANLASAAVAVAVAVDPFGSALDVLSEQPLAGVPFVALVALGAAGVYVAETHLAELTMVRAAPTPGGSPP